MDRRDFLKTSTVAVAGFAASRELFASSATIGTIPRRLLGKTGEHLSIFGVGGTSVMSITQAEANNLVAEAVDRGVNFFDVSPTYGNSEERMGPALEPYRKRCFLASKTDHRDRAGLEADFNNSLKLLRTDHFDLYQHHALDKMSELDRIYAPGGGMEALAAAKKAGKVRFIGLSTHSVQIAMAAMDRGGLDTLMFPINYVLFNRANVGPQVLERVRKEGIGLFAIKGMARGKYAANLPEDKHTPKCWYEPCSLPEEASLAFRWTLSKPITAATSPGNPAWFRIALDLAQNFRPITKEETKKLLTFAQSADPLFSLDV